MTLNTLCAWLPTSRSRPAPFSRFSVMFLSVPIALSSAAVFGYFTSARMILHQPGSAYLPLLPLISLFPLTYAAGGLYPGFGLGAVETLRRLFYYTTISFLAA